MCEQIVERPEDVVGAGISWRYAVWADAAHSSMEFKA